MAIRRKTKGAEESTFQTIYTKLLKCWFNIVILQNDISIDVEVDIFTQVGYKSSINHKKISIIPAEPLYDKKVIDEFCDYLKNYSDLTKEQIVKVKQIKDEKFKLDRKKIEILYAEIEKVKIQNAEIIEFCNSYDKIDNDEGLNEKINTIFTNYFKKYVKQTYLQSEYLYELYNYLLQNNVLFKNMNGKVKELSELTYPKSESHPEFKLQKIDMMVDFLQKEIACSSKNCAKIITFVIIYNVALTYYSNYFDELHGKEFTDIKNLSLQDAVLKFINLNSIDENDELRGMFVYFLISKDKFETSDVLKGYVKCKQKLIEIYIKLKSEKDYNNFINNILSDNKTDEEVYSIDDIDLMTGFEFESYVSQLFKRMGYKTIITQASGDQGIDVIAEKNGRKYGIQAKCYSGAVSNSAIQEVVAGVSYYKCDKAIVITNNNFTKSAIELARANSVVLWDREMLKQKINDIFYK